MSEALQRTPNPDRPWDFAPIANRAEIFAEVFERMTEGESLAKICESDSLPGIRTLFRWLNVDEDAWQDYLRAREVQAHLYAARATDEAFAATDAGLGKLRVDTLKWAAGKLAGKWYGDNMQLRHADAEGGKLDTAPLVNELLTLLPGDNAQNITPRPAQLTSRNLSTVKPEVVKTSSNLSTVPPARQAQPVLIDQQPTPRRIPTPRAAGPAYRPRARRDVEDLV